jgi:hypothetical protein
VEFNYSNRMIMIGINTLYKSSLVSTHSSSFLYLPSPTILFTRYYTVECSLVQLSADIDFIYQDLTENLEFSMSHYRLAVIQQKIVSGLYVLSPLQVRYLKKEDLTQFLHDTLPDCPDIQLGYSSDPDILYVVMPDKDDVLVLMGLSLMLLRHSYGGMPKDGYRLVNLVHTFYYSIQNMGNVDRLYRIDLMASLRIIPISLILDKVKHFVGESSVYKLISSFLILPIIDENGNDRSDISFGGMPPVGEITRVLFNIVLMDIFDREFAKRFPGVAFSRYLNEVFISTRGNDEIIFDEKSGYALLEELSLAGKIVSIGPGDHPLQCYNRIVFLDSDSNVHVCDPMEYF